MLGQLEVFVELSRGLEVVEVRANLAELLRRGRSLRVSLEQPAIGDDLLDELPVTVLEAPQEQLHRLPQWSVSNDEQANPRIGGHQLRQRGDSHLHSLRRDEPADVEQHGVMFPIELRQLVFDVGVGRLGVVLDARERGAHLLGRRGGVRAGEHRRQLLRPPAARLAGERHEQLADLLSASLARHRLELRRVHAERQHAELLGDVVNVGEDRLDAMAHLGAVDEDPAGSGKCRRRQLEKAIVLLHRVLERAAVRHHRVGNAGLLADA